MILFEQGLVFLQDKDYPEALKKSNEIFQTTSDHKKYHLLNALVYEDQKLYSKAIKEFDQIADTFRDPRVWWIDDGQWWKDNLWGEPSVYGPVYLSPDAQGKYKKAK